MSFERKYDLTVDENIFIAKRNLVDYIWKSARLEGLSVTFPDTEAIFNGMSVSNVRVDEIIAVNNLKRSWQFLFDTIDSPTDFRYICQLNRIVGGDNLVYNAGYLRRVPVSIGGTSWKPDIPDEPLIKKGLADIFETENPTERCITLMLYCMRSQMFLDGNKRTSMLAANHEMIKNGCGIISVPIEHQPEFTKLLVEFYETNEMIAIKQFVYDKCIDGINMGTQRRSVEDRNER
ncbi:MAG: Fic family protein [Bacteroides sp.]|nr:Fic family protein [Eubacterium sp.]MCM1419160.1 Fic family protein [Roseburia sp.]MCM1463057.1 Fic family protein [Bacteroides sp.]